MDTRLDITTGDHSALPPELAESTHNKHNASLFPVLALIGLAIAAIIPRVILALQLDVVTDEVVYLWAAKVYAPLLMHFNITSPEWGTVNPEHPPLAKIFMGFSIELNNVLGQPVGQLFAGRLPSVVMGTILVLGVYWFGRAPFGRTISLLAALALAFSPWLCYFSAIAYLDMTMTSFVTLTYLVLWHATRRPKLYPVVAILMGMALASKYPAGLALPAIVLFVAYYYFLLRPMMPADQRPAIPWRWWGVTLLLTLVAFFVADPAIWIHTRSKLEHSYAVEAAGNLSSGHLVYLGGHIMMHVPKWTIVYMTFTKMSAFLTLPAAFFVIFALVQMVRFHLRKSSLDHQQIAKYAYLTIWLLGVMAGYSLLNIAVGTHYYLPLAPSVAVAGVSGLAIILRYVASLIWKKSTQTSEIHQETVPAVNAKKRTFKPQIVIPLAILAVLAIAPGLLGLTTVYGAEGYTNEFFDNNELPYLQVAYPAYREALDWLETQTPDKAKVGLIGTYLTGQDSTSNWFAYNQPLTQRFQLSEINPIGPTNVHILEVLPTDPAHPITLQNYQSYDYLVWPSDMSQRGSLWPPQYQVIHTINGGNTVYCYILKVVK
jgi:4-amino-4-deoxy-L-arabinose transferase-like glycosyltransferase